MKLNKYLEFITESNLDLILEAKISFLPKFSDILNKIKSPIAKQLLDLVGKDVDVNTNYIDIDLSKDVDIITFIPDNKVKEEDVNTAVISNPVYSYTSHSQLFKYAGLNVQHLNTPDEGDTVKIIREFSPRELASELKLSYSSSIVWVKSTKNGNDYFIGIEGILKKPINIKGNDIKVGRFAGKLLAKAGIKVTDKEIEEFVNQFKAKLNLMKDALSRFKIVSGEDIRNYYSESVYSESCGSLGGSCMRYDRCQKYLDIYVFNPKQVSLIILMSEIDDEKISGRAILWTGNVICDDTNDESKKNVKFMDRAYTNDSSDETLFKEFATKNGFYYKKVQSNDEYMIIMFNGEELDEDKFEVTLEKKKYDYYPYMDTLKYYSENGVIKNDDSNYDYKLESTEGSNGECDTCGGEGTHTCGECDGDGEVSCNECDGDGNIRCSECSGEGSYDCGECDGVGEVDCDICDGSGKDDEDDDCDDCNGTGKKPCSCDDGTIKCEECDGDGETECGDCYGRGERECYSCEGCGNVNCDDC